MPRALHLKGGLMKMLGCTATAILMMGLLYPQASSAQPKEPPTTGAPKAEAAGEQVAPEEMQRRKDWNKSMLRKAAPKKGCFKVDYPKTDWQELQCVPAPNIPMVPRHGPRPLVIGNTNDISAGAPSGTISQAIGHFENITNVTSESGPIGNTGPAVANAYTLQINTNPFTSTACSGSPNPSCQGWEQFVFWNDGTAGSIFIQYWLLNYNATCPAGWNQFTFTGGTTIYCWRNAAGLATPVPNQPITNIGNWTFSGAVTATTDGATLSTGTTAYTKTGDNSVNVASGWTGAEFNIFGAGGNSSGGGMASFNPGASVVTRTEIIYGGTAAPNCLAQGYTGETNNLNFGPTAPAATAPGPAVIFTESTAGGAASNCAAASTIGDTHLRTFNGLFYDFQASGDFVLAEVDPNFTVQTRQVSGAPTWPDASVNKAVAARFGKTQVALCLSPPGSEQSARLIVDGKAATVVDGQPMLTPEDVTIARLGNIYHFISEAGDSVRATVNPTWIDVSVGLGRWPSTVHGLIANANGNVNQIETRDHFVLTNPFNFSDLYGRFAESWRVSEKDSMLAVCEARELERGVPKRTFFAKDLPEEVRQKAHGVCTAAGVKPGPLLDACTLDVAVIGNDAAAKVFVDASPPAAVGTITGGGGGGGGILEQWWWLLLLLLVLIIIVWFVIRKKNP
jgi:hypothetical protein